MIKFNKANWITPSVNYGNVCPIFKKTFTLEKPLKNATLFITALGVYEAQLNGKRVGDYILAPGWTSYEHRIQYQEYDVTDMLMSDNELNITVGKGWMRGLLTWKPKVCYPDIPAAVICELQLTYENGAIETINSDESFMTARSNILFSEIYDGEIYNACEFEQKWDYAAVLNYTKNTLVPQEGERIREIETVKPVRIIESAWAEKIIDFGQNLTGYIRFKPTGEAGDVLEITHAEVLDKEGKFYTANLRLAKQRITYICSGNDDWYNPHFTFQGFRYIKLEKWSGGVDLSNFEAVVVHSDIKRTGHFECSNEKVNKLFSNIIWSQKGNFLDVPTDCPQRDERLGWTGDAQMFIRTASYNYDVEGFFRKWLRDLAVDQMPNGGIPAVIPTVFNDNNSSAAWGDAAVICPWQIYLTYGNRDVLSEQFDSMVKWIEYIREQGDNEFLWNTGQHFGDWLGLDAKPGSYRGATDEGLIATAYFAHSINLIVKAGKVLERDMTEYERLYAGVVDAFRSEFVKGNRLISDTQTAYALALYFNLVDNKQEMAARLADMVRNNGNRLQTGFVGTPYLLHALSDNGYHELAYTLLLQEDYPSWLYSVNQGATTMWEHWDGINDKGEMWSVDMNSFNHYAYGAVADWMYGVAAGINTDEENPGFGHIVFKPKADLRLEYAKASIYTQHGIVSSGWKQECGGVKYTFEVPNGCSATVELNGDKHEISAGVKEIFAAGSL